MTEDELTEYFSFLDELRESGVTNMYGSPPYLTRKFGLPSRDARRVFVLWSETIGDRSATPRERAKMAVAD